MITTTEIFTNNNDPMPTVRLSRANTNTSWHTLRIENVPYGNVALNIHAVSLEALADFGRAIVAACDEAAPDSADASLVDAYQRLQRKMMADASDGLLAANFPDD